LKPGNAGHRLHDEMEVQDMDIVLDKTRFSAFAGSSCELDCVLRERNIETLIVTARFPMYVRIDGAGWNDAELPDNFRVRRECRTER